METENAAVTVTKTTVQRITKQCLLKVAKTINHIG
jgi:hypothetical protein